MSSLRILMYHKVQKNRRDFLTVDVAQLRQQLEFLKKKYHIIRLSELMAHLQTGETLPENALLITFDDGYRSNYELAYPIFREMNIPFSIFLVADFIGKKHLYDGDLQEFLTVEQLSEMQDLAEYGLHSNTHQDLMNLPENLWFAEFSKCIQTLEKLPVKIQKAWAYTYGNFPRNNPELIEKLNKALIGNNITCAFRIGNRINKLPLKNPFYIERIDVRGNDSHFKFRLKTLFGKFL